MINVIIPVHNRLKLTIKCINSLKEQYNFSNLKIIVVDDASTDNTFQYLKENFKNIIILKGSGSLFWGGAVNYGIEYVLKNSETNDWILLVNNDVELSVDTIKKLIEVSESKNRKAIVGALTVSSTDKQTIIKSGTIVKSWFLNITKHIFKDKKIMNLTLKNYEKVDLLTGRCLLHPIEIFKRVGNYDSKRFVHYGADDEFSMRIKKYGYSSLLCTSTIVFLEPNFEKKKITFFENFFGIRSSSNIINKFKFTLEVVPIYAKLSFFLISIIKSLFIYLKKI